MALLVGEKDLAALFRDPSSMDDLLELVEASVAAHRQGKVPNQGGFSIPMPDGRRNLRVLTATLPDTGEVLRVYPLFAGAKDAHFNLLFDPRSGDLLALIAGATLNPWRTGAPAGIACRHLARPGAKLVGLIGSGRQAQGQLVAIRRALPSLERVRVFSPTEENRNRFAKEMSSWLGIEVEPVDRARAALEGAPIVTVATNSRAPVVESRWISPGALVISIASGQLPPDLVTRSRVFVSWKEELLNARPPREPYATMIASGSWSPDRIAGELGDVVAGKVSGRPGDAQTVLFEMPGMPAWDAAATAWAYRWALKRKIGTSFSLG